MTLGQVVRPHLLTKIDHWCCLSEKGAPPAAAVKTVWKLIVPSSESSPLHISHHGPQVCRGRGTKMGFLRTLPVRIGGRSIGVTAPIHQAPAWRGEPSMLGDLLQ